MLAAALYLNVFLLTCSFATIIVLHISEYIFVFFYYLLALVIALSLYVILSVLLVFYKYISIYNILAYL